MLGLIEKLLNEQKMNETVLTDNGAVVYKTTGRALLDMNFGVTALRKATTDKHIIDTFLLSYNEEPTLALKWLFYARDVRGGMGEKRIFKVVMTHLLDDPEEYNIPHLIKFIPEYGSWKDVFHVYNFTHKAQVRTVINDMIERQLEEDLDNMSQQKSVSLCAKWMPSINTSSSSSRFMAKVIANSLKMTDKEYRQTLSKLRKYIDVVEVKMCANEWDKIDYEKVPSQANLKYKDVFARRDIKRREEYLSKVEAGTAKIAAGALFPSDIVAKYNANSRYKFIRQTNVDITLEEMWKAQPNYGIKDTLVVADGSGSMTSAINSNLTCLDVANALAIYCSERNSGEFKDKYITFSEKPQLVDFTNCKTLMAKLQHASNFNEVANTNIERVFDLVLQTAVDNHMQPEEMVKNILIISDMNFDNAAAGDTSEALFVNLAKRFKSFGYELPKLSFWNVNQRVVGVPVQMNKNGVTLVGGYSPAVLSMVMDGSADPFVQLQKKLNSERYEQIK